MSFQMVLLHCLSPFSIRSSFGTMSFQMVLLQAVLFGTMIGRFGTMSFQMVLLHDPELAIVSQRFGTMSFQMVLLRTETFRLSCSVLELCHSRWFYYQENLHVRFLFVLL